MSKRLTDFPIVRYEDHTPVYRIPLSRVKKNPLAIKIVDPNDDIDLSDGQKRAIMVKLDGTIIDGARRVAALRRLHGPSEVDAFVVDTQPIPAMQTMLDLNTMVSVNTLALDEEDFETILLAIGHKTDRYRFDKPDLEVIEKIFQAFPALRKRYTYMVK